MLAYGPVRNTTWELTPAERNREIWAVGAGWTIITYTTIGDLVDQIVAELGMDYLLRELEISAHGNPRGVDELSAASAQTLAARWLELYPDDETDIYLSGCNTGCRWQTGARCIAEIVSDLIPPGPPTLQPKTYRCTVYGSVGTLTGTHAGGDASATASSFLWSRDGAEATKTPSFPWGAYRGFRGENSA